MRCRGGEMARRNTLRALLAGLRCVGLRLDATAPPPPLPTRYPGTDRNDNQL